MKKYDFEKYKEKHVLFITTKNLDYIRNTQEIELIRQYAGEVDIIGSSSPSYLKRVLGVYYSLLMKNMKDIDCIFIGFSPQLVLPFFFWKLRKHVTIDFFISMYDTFVMDRRRFKQGTLGAKLCKALDKRTLALADDVVCDTVAHGRYFVEELAAKAEDMHVLYLQADKSIYYPRAQKKSAGEAFEVMYFGSVLPLQGVEIILEALTYFKDKKDIHFTIIGPIGKEYRKTIQDNVTYIQWASQEELAEYIAKADLCLSGHFNAEIEKAKRTIPGKAYIYEAMEKTMILGDGPANHELFLEDEKHYFVEMGNPVKLAEMIKKIRQEKTESR